MADDADAAVVTRRREGVDGTFEAVERMRFAPHHDLKRLVVVVATSFALGHDVTSFC